MDQQIQPPHRLCMSQYVRRVPWVEAVITFTCQYPQAHDGSLHSWSVLKERDDAVIAEMNRVQEDTPIPGEIPVDSLLAAIIEGLWDDYLEQILAVAHERKRARRGKRSFSTVDLREKHDRAG